jgi:selenocysteine lyase/cysteine desulfurase
MINLTGQVLPLQKLLSSLRSEIGYGATLVVDAAHSVAHVPYDWSTCTADVVAGSLHKWMCCPVGVGFLKINPEKMNLFWPLMGDSRLPKNDIRRFEHQGTRPLQHIEAISLCLELQAKMGPLPEKAARLQYLQQSWTTPLRKSGSPYRLWTPQQNERSYAIATVSHEKYTATRFSQLLWDQFKIFTVAVEHPVVQGVRITPHLSNSISDISKLNTALSALA